MTNKVTKKKIDKILPISHLHTKKDIGNWCSPHQDYIRKEHLTMQVDHLNNEVSKT